MGQAIAIRAAVRHCAGFLLAALVLGANPACAQKNGLAFWELDAQHVDPVLQLAPKKDAVRLDFLRRSFANFECSAARMQEQPAGRHNARNLLCTLPGQTSDTILVLTRFDDRSKTRPTWPDALMLPLLYHALQAQPRQHTFVFVAVDGDSGVDAFSRWQHRPGQSSPATTIVLDNLALGRLRLFLTQPRHHDKIVPGESPLKLMNDEATKTAQLMHMPDPTGVWAYEYSDVSSLLGQQFQQVTQSTLAYAALQSPEAILYSQIGTPMSSTAFHQDFDFLAWYLCDIDTKLPPTGQPAPH